MKFQEWLPANGWGCASSDEIAEAAWNASAVNASTRIQKLESALNEIAQWDADLPGGSLAEGWSAGIAREALKR